MAVWKISLKALSSSRSPMRGENMSSTGCGIEGATWLWEQTPASPSRFPGKLSLLEAGAALQSSRPCWYENRLQCLSLHLQEQSFHCRQWECVAVLANLLANPHAVKESVLSLRNSGLIIYLNNPYLQIFLQLILQLPIRLRSSVTSAWSHM